MTTWQTFKNDLAKIFRPPGLGIYTVSAGKEKKEQLHQKIYKTKNVDEVNLKWLESLNLFPLSLDVTLFAIPSDNGGGIQRGANWGPLYLREKLITTSQKLPYFDIGDVFVNPHLLEDKYLNEKTINTCRLAQYQDENLNLPVSPLSIADFFCKFHHELFPSKKIFMIGGDHSVSYPVIKNYLNHKKKQNKKTAIIHFDAHTDLLSERLGIDVCFGSWAGNIIKELSDPSLLIQVGVRSSAHDKNYWVNKLGVTQYWSHEILKVGIGKVTEEIIELLTKKNVDEIYVTFDVDVLSSEYCLATGTPEPNGLSPHEPMYLLQCISEKFKITGADIVEIAPLVKGESLGKFIIEPESTLCLSQAFAEFLIGTLKVS